MERGSGEANKGIKRVGITTGAAIRGGSILTPGRVLIRIKESVGILLPGGPLYYRTTN